MIGSIKWNMVTAIAAMALTFGLSLSNNPVTTTCIRAIYAFIIVFILIFAVRFVLGTLAGLNNMDTIQDTGTDAGHSIDLATPNDDEAINSMLMQQLSSDSQPDVPVFEPLKPQRLVTKKEQLDSELLARSVREMSEE